MGAQYREIPTLKVAKKACNASAASSHGIYHSNIKISTRSHQDYNYLKITYN